MGFWAMRAARLESARRRVRKQELPITTRARSRLLNVGSPRPFGKAARTPSAIPDYPPQRDGASSSLTNGKSGRALRAVARRRTGAPGECKRRGLISRCVDPRGPLLRGGRRLGGRRRDSRSSLLALHRRALDGGLLRSGLLDRPLLGGGLLGRSLLHCALAH